MSLAIPYIRFSAIHQGAGSSVQRQEELISKWLADNSEYERFNQSFKDLGKSGYKGDHLNHGMGKILASIDTGVFSAGDVILVEAIDRVGRLEPMEMIKLISQIVSAGVEIVTLQDLQTYSQERLNNDSGCLYILIGKIQQAHDYSKSLSKRLTKAWERKRVKAREGEEIRLHTPFWLNTDGTLIPDRAEAVKDCINLYLKGKGHRGILLELSMKYTCLKGVHPSSLKRWFKHRALIGEWDHSRSADQALEPVRGVFERLIDDTTYYQLQATAEHRTRVMGPEATYEIAGLVVCGECDANYHFRRKKHKEDVIIYGNCSSYLKRGALGCSNNKTYPYEVLIEIFKLTYYEYLMYVVIDKLNEQMGLHFNILNKQLEEIEDRIEKVITLLEEVPDLGNLVDRLKKLKVEKDAKLSEIAALKGEVKYEGLDRDAPYKSYNEIHEELDADPLHRREVLKKAGYQIICKPEVIKVAGGPAGLFEFKVEKRSQKYGCYFVNKFVPAHKILLADYEEEDYEQYGEEIYVHYSDENIMVAISRNKGVIAAESTLDDLIEELENPTPEKTIEEIEAEYIAAGGTVTKNTLEDATTLITWG